ncbi:hypothetical protein Pmar_PMAR020341 [Perkinsus marinus ATCC 50983]|uniref:Uncharacterized protein n=1 Tax=Perkinsus marinus (strain ATCC 50983 / TXsc) TaxID=423536 RepID=C5KFF1_PERM5|nr:hypothetical protein Pmar_PMAR020341 [Perkinsus marinus ATCC 50983]EER16811.1 hypothetical protein Pmar_PMAR020341 [Perkinsus marinus ATCC 50983]|eukprot:XP_002785015.1 hypothetical protein Pmar_PMAR020341 [Perkinsus marinus ATCC 50983]
MPIVSVPTAKARAIQQDIDKVLESGRITLQAARRLTGRLLWFGRTLRADLSLWRVGISELHVTLLATASGVVWTGASDASLPGLGGWARVKSSADDRATILYFHATLADIPPEWYQVIFQDRRAPEPADVAALELLASGLLVCMVVSRMIYTNKLVLFSDNSSCIRALERCFSSTSRGAHILRSLALVLSSLPFCPRIEPVHLPGKSNILADAVSRHLPTAIDRIATLVPVDELFRTFDISELSSDT